MMSDIQDISSVFLAIRHASAAMKVTNPSKGKELSGGSIILTASGKVAIPLIIPPLLIIALQWPDCNLEQGLSIVSSSALYSQGLRSLTATNR